MNLSNLENFLISHSSINNKFITDFFGFQKRSELKEYEPFIIDLENVVFWLEARKDTLKETLIESYNKDLDYIIIKKGLRDNLERFVHNNEFTDIICDDELTEDIIIKIIINHYNVMVQKMQQMQ